MADNKLINKISTSVGRDMDGFINHLDDHTLERFVNIMQRPNIQVRVNTTRAPFGVTLNTPYGTIQLDNQLVAESMYVNGTKFTVLDTSIDGVEKLVGGVESAKEVLGETQGRQRRGRKVRSRRRTREEVPFEEVQQAAEEEIRAAGVNYDNLFDELGGLMANSNVTAKDLADELYSNRVDENDIAHFLVYESQYRNNVISKAYNLPLGSQETEYNFQPVTADDSFLGRLITSLGETEAEYDAEMGALRINDRVITNLPSVDENGIFSNGQTRYIPYHVGYFAEGEGSRVDRLRVIDPVQTALDSVKLQYDLTNGDIKFQTILDVTRNLAEYDNHPYGQEILDTLKKKVVLDKSLLVTNSLHAEFKGKTDENGAVALTMLDEDAEGVIDPLGTSNGGNMGAIFYLTKDAEFNPDGSITRGQSKYSAWGEVMSQFHVDKDNFNRNQMSFNAGLTSYDIKLVNVAFAEMGMFNAEDTIWATKAGAELFAGEGEHQKAKVVGDKMQDMGHGDKGVIGFIADPDMDMDEAVEKGEEFHVQMAKDNPDLHFVVSPISVASRMNMGIAHEGLMGQNKMDLKLPNGEVVKDGITQMMYMSLPQTVEHKSKDYSVDNGARKYSSLYRYALSSKIGEEFYKEAFINEDVRAQHIDEIATAFQRLGVTFENEDASMVKKGNVFLSVTSPATISADDLSMMTPAVIRKKLTEEMVDGQINIDLGDTQLISPMTKEPVVDEYGRNVLPIRVTKDGGIPFRYNEMFEKISLNNIGEMQRAYDHAIGNDYSQLTRKNNLLKNIDTMAFEEGARTDVLIFDPRLGLNEVRSELKDDIVAFHRDPAIKSGNTLVGVNVGGGAPGTLATSPMIVVMQDSDGDGDTQGGKDLLHLSDETREAMLMLASPVENLNHYGEVNLSLGGHFKAMVTASGEDVSDITFANGESNHHVARIVEDHMHNMLKNPNVYGAYAVSFTDEKTVLDSLGKLADDGIKGNREEMEHRFHEGYTVEENRAVMKALIAKSEWTGLAGAITNNVIAAMGEKEFDAELVRVTFDMTHTMTQSVLQMKKNADKLPIIDESINKMKAVMAGKEDAEQARETLKDITKGLIPEAAVDKFVDIVVDRQANLPYRTEMTRFGDGVLSGTGMTTTKLAYITGNNFSNAIRKVAEQPHAVTEKPVEQPVELDADTLKDLESLEASMGL